MDNIVLARKERNNLPAHTQKIQRVFYQHRQRMHFSNSDYQTAGPYAITICAHDRHNNLFDTPAAENILKEEWNHLPQHFAGIALDIHVVMPDHLHCIIWHNGQGENTKSIIDVIKGYKSLCTIAWRQHINGQRADHHGQLWQKNFFDHIIRNETDLENQRVYKLNNPLSAALKKGKTEIEGACEYNSCGHIPFPPE
jgi:REP element-mobilizing transposase RayT